jgi:DNA polymerase-1
LLLEKLLQQNSVCFDTETTGLDAIQAELVGIAFSWEQQKGYYLVMPEDRGETQAIIDAFRPFFENQQIEKIGHNLKYDLKVLIKYDLKVFGPLYDTYDRSLPYQSRYAAQYGCFGRNLSQLQSTVHWRIDR